MELLAGEMEMPVDVQKRVDYSLEQADRTLQRHIELLDVLRRYAVRATRPEDWIDVAGDGTGILLQGVGAERLLTRLPLRWKMQITDVAYQEWPAHEPPFGYIVTGNISVQIPGFPPVELEGIQAGRAADGFFRSGAKGRNEEIDPLDVKAAAESAWKRRAITAALGLRGLSIDDLKALTPAGWIDGVRKIERRAGPTGTKYPDAGSETTFQLENASTAHRELRARLAKLIPDRTLWPDALAKLTHDPTGKFPDRRSILGLTDRAAAAMLGRLTAMGPMEAAELAGTYTPAPVPATLGTPPAGEAA